jgi:hypothetical protein
VKAQTAQAVRRAVRRARQMKGRGQRAAAVRVTAARRMGATRVKAREGERLQALPKRYDTS